MPVSSHTHSDIDADSCGGFKLSSTPIDLVALRASLAAARAGAWVEFTGCVRDHNAGRRVRRMDYQAYAPAAEHEGQRILTEARDRFGLSQARCMHRVGSLEIGDVAVWVGVSAAHRDAAFAACRWIIDTVKQRVPIWKNEHYTDGESGWLHPEQGES